jgi:hypothetical protein
MSKKRVRLLDCLFGSLFGFSIVAYAHGSDLWVVFLTAFLNTIYFMISISVDLKKGE